MAECSLLLDAGTFHNARRCAAQSHVDVDHYEAACATQRAGVDSVGLRVGTAWSGLGAGLASGSLDALRLRLTSVPLAVSPIRAGGIFTGGSLMESESESARGGLRLLPNLAFVAGRTVTPSRRIMP
jgi:hypothetical protein